MAILEAYFLNLNVDPNAQKCTKVSLKPASTIVHQVRSSRFPGIHLARAMNQAVKPKKQHRRL